MLLVPPRLHTYYQICEEEKASGALVVKQQGKDLCLLYQSFFNFAFSSRLCDAGSSLRLWCLASTLKSPWITDGYLVALQCCTSSAYISPFLLLFLCFARRSAGSLVASSVDVKRSCLHCFLLHFVFRELDVDFFVKIKREGSVSRSPWNIICMIMKAPIALLKWNHLQRYIYIYCVEKWLLDYYFKWRSARVKSINV